MATEKTMTLGDSNNNIILTLADGGAVKTNKILAPTTSNGETYGAGTNGQVLKTNGTKVYWGSDSWRPVQNNLTSTSTTDSLSAYQGKILANSKATMRTLTSENLNSVVTPGFYNAGNGNTVTNKPSGVEHFGLEVIHGASGAYYTQIIHTDTTTYRRKCVSGIWGAWKADKYTDTTYTPATLGFGYGTCSTEATTTAKTVAISNYNLITGGIVAIKFTNSVPASATLNINGKGAKSIYDNGAAIQANIIRGGDLATFVYDGSYYHLIAIEHRPRLDNNTIYFD